MVEIYQNFHFLARSSGIFSGLIGRVSIRISYKTVTVRRRTHHTGDGSVIRAGADCHLQIARQDLGTGISEIQTFVNHQAGRKSRSLCMNGLKPGLHLVIRVNTSSLAVALFPAAGNCITHRLAGNILDQQPARE